MRLKYSGWLNPYALWAPSGIQTIKEPVAFEPTAGPFDGMMDDCDDWHFVLPDGRCHSNKLKYTSWSYYLQPVVDSILVQCRYYDQNPDIANYVTIYYYRPLAALILQNETLIFPDASGDVEDFDLHGGRVVHLEAV